MENSEKKKTGPAEDKRPENDFESPQTEESRRLAKTKSDDAVERHDKNPDDEGKTRGGNQSMNQS